MSRIDKSISDTLGIEFDSKTKVPKVIKEKPQELVVTEDVPETIARTDVEEDYKFSRDTLKGIIETGGKAVHDAQYVAMQNEHPDSYKALAALIKTVASATKDLYEIHQRTKEMKVEPGKKVLDNGNINVDKAIFVGTTSDLLKQLKSKDSE